MSSCWVVASGCQFRSSESSSRDNSEARLQWIVADHSFQLSISKGFAGSVFGFGHAVRIEHNAVELFHG